MLTDGFHWNLSHSKSPQVFWTLLSIQTALNKVVWIFSAHHMISNSFSTQP